MSGLRSRLPRTAVFGALVFACVGITSSAQSAGGDPTQPVAEIPGGGEEIPALRSADSRTYRLADGTYSTEIYEGPIHYRASNADWRPIDNTLVPSSRSGYALENKENRFSASLPASAGGRVRFGLGGDWITFALARSAATTGVKVAPNEESFENALHGATINYAVLNTGLKETIRLADAEAPRSFTFDLALSPGLEPQAREEGGIDFVGSDGEPRFSIPAPLMEDSSGSDEGFSQAVSLTLAQSGSDLTLTIEADEAWLADPARVWPVTIDPTLNVPQTGDSSRDCHITEGTPTTSFCGDTPLRIGQSSGSARRGLFYFDLSSYKGGYTVTNADLSLNCERGSTSNGADYPLKRLTAPGGNAGAQWTSQATWNKYASGSGNAWSSPGGDFTGTFDTRSMDCASPGYKAWSATSVVQNWIDGTWTNYGLIIKQADPENVTNLIDFTSLEGTQSKWPKLVITYTNVAPAVPSGLSPANASITTDTTPTLSAVYSDADPGDEGQVQFQVCNDSPCTSIAASGTSTQVSSGQSGTFTPTLAAGKRYFWQARGLDGGTTPSAWSTPLLELDVNNQPSQPTNLLPADGTASTSATPTLSGTYSDPDSGDAGYVEFQLCTDADCGSPVLTGGSGTNVSSGQTSSWAVPAGTLQAGTTYYWRARGYDGIERGPWTDSTFTYRRIAAPTNSALPSISGSARVGQVLTAATGTWSDNPTSYSYQWRTCDLGGANCTNKSGATASTYTVASADEYKTFRVVVTATNAAGSTSATSEATDTALRVCGTGEAVTAAITVPSAPHPIVSGTTTVTASATSAHGKVTLVEFYLDGVLISSVKPTPAASVNASTSWNTFDPANPAYDGEHIVTAIGYDGCASGTSPDKTITVANRTGYYFASFLTTPAPIEAAAGVPADSKMGFEVTVSNDSPSGNENYWLNNSVFLRYRWIAPDGTSVADGPNVAFPYAIAPNGPFDAPTLTVLVDPPPLGDFDRGSYRLRFDLWDQATNSWFSEHGNPPLDNPIQVNKDIESQALGLERYYSYDREPLGAGIENLVNVASGDSILRWTPFASPGRGLSTVVDLTYNSLEDKAISPAGNNFSIAISSLTRLGLPLDIHPNPADNVAYPTNAPRWAAFTDGDGTRHRFTLKQSAGGLLYGEEPAGVHLWLRELAAGDPNGKWAITRPDRVTFYFDAGGYPLSVVDRNGNRITYTLEDVPPAEDPGGLKKRITQITDAGGRSFAIDYWSKSETKKPQQRGKIQRITDHTGSALDFDYYTDGNLLKLTQRGGTKADGTTLNDRSFVFTYTTPDGSGPAIPSAEERKSPDAKKSPQSSVLYSVRDPRGNETIFTYCSATSCNNQAQNRWKLKTRTNREGKTTNFAYDILASPGPKTTVNDPLDNATEYTLGNDSTPSVNNLGSPTAVKDALGKTTTLAWTPDRQLERVTEPSGAYTKFTYNNNGDLTSQSVLVDPKLAGEADDLLAKTTLTYQAVVLPEDSLDVAANWKSGRTIAHRTQLVSKTDPLGNAAGAAPNSYKWSFTYDSKGNLITATDPANNTTTYAWATGTNGPGTLTSITDPRAATTPGDTGDYITRFFDYDANGFSTRIVNPRLHGTDGDETTRLTYDADGLLRSIQDARHASYTGTDTPSYRTELKYDSFNRLGLVSEPRQTSVERGTPNEKLVWTRVDYDENDNIVAQKAPGLGAPSTPTFGETTSYVYDRMDRPTTASAPARKAGEHARVTRATYDGVGQLATVTLPNGTDSAKAFDFMTEYGYDSDGRVIKVKRYADTGSSSGARITLYCYDLSTGDVVSVTPPRGATGATPCAATSFNLTYSYDPAHRLLTETDAGGRTRTYGYDLNGNATTIRNENATTQTRYYDQRNLLTHVRQPFQGSDDVWTHYQYDQVGNLSKLVTPRAWDFSPDPELDAQGNPAKTAFSKYVTTYSYDAMNRLVKTTLPEVDTPTGPEPGFVYRSYDAVGNLTAVSIPVTTNDENFLTSGAANTRTNYTYFDPGWIASGDNHTGANSQVTYAYNARGEQTTRTVAGVGTETWDYYPDGLLAVAGDRNGNGANFDYDLNGKLLSAIDNRGGGQNGKGIEVQATYTGFGELKTSQSRRASDLSDPSFHATSYIYDLDGNIGQRTDPDGSKQHFLYDVAGRLLRQVGDNGTPTDCSDDQRVKPDYEPAGWEKERIVSRGVGTSCSAAVPEGTPSWNEPASWSQKQRTTWTYFLNGRLDTLVTRNASDAIVESHDVGYLDGNNDYADGNPTRDTFKLIGPSGDQGQCATTSCDQTYTYDARDRLTDESRPGLTVSYKLDPAGNVTCSTRNGTPIGFSYTGTQLTAQLSICGGAPTLKYWYEGEGALNCVTTSAGTLADCLNDTATTCPATAPNTRVTSDNNYDQLKRLTRVCTYSGGSSQNTATYLYDALGRPFSETARRGAAATPRTTTFGYLGMSDLVASETTKTAPSSGTPVTLTDRAYTYDAFSHRISMTNTPTTSATGPMATAGTFTYAYDVHGSASALLDQDSGQTTAIYGYDAYGQADGGLTRGDTGATGLASDAENALNPYRYSAKRLDPGSGTYDMGARRFGPDIRRFQQPDLYRGALSDLSLTLDPLSGNRYALASGNPVGYSEVDGHALDQSTNGTAADLSSAATTTAATVHTWVDQDRAAAGAYHDPSDVRHQPPGSSGAPWTAPDTRDFMPCGGGTTAELRQHQFALAATCGGTYLGPSTSRELEGFLALVSLTPPGRAERGAQVAVEEGPSLVRGVVRWFGRDADEAAPVATGGWHVGDSIDALTSAGTSPAWSTVRARYWKNTAAAAAEGEYSAANLARMRTGRAPLHDEIGVSMELHHVLPKSQGGTDALANLTPVWPWEHSIVDPFRHYTGPIP